MRRALTLHPDSRCIAGTAIGADIARPSPDCLELRYLLTGKIDQLRMPPVTASSRTDGLWQHTCLEAFVRVAAARNYLEFNFAPSTAWAAYRFDDYRVGMNAAADVPAPSLEVRSTDTSFELRATLAFDHESGLPLDTAWSIGLSAVIEENSGRKSYWALAHPPGEADFHHADCFALTLSAAGRQ